MMDLFEKMPCLAEPRLPVRGGEGFNPHLAASIRSMDEPAVTDEDSDVVDSIPARREEKNIAWLQQIRGNLSSGAGLFPGRAWYMGEAGLPVNPLYQRRAIESVGVETAVAIRGVQVSECREHDLGPTQTSLGYGLCIRRRPLLARRGGVARAGRDENGQQEGGEERGMRSRGKDHSGSRSR